MTLRHLVAYGLIAIMVLLAFAGLLLARRRQLEARRIARGGRQRTR